MAQEAFIDGNQINNARPLAVEQQGAVTATVTGDVTINNAAGDGVYVRPGTSATWAVADTWRASLVAEETADDSDKTLTVPASTEYQLLSVWVELTTTADVGDRQLEVQIQDSAGDVIAQVQAGIVQAASLTRNYLFALNVPDLTAFRDTSFLMSPLPCLVLPAGYKVRVFDNNAVAAAADDMVVQMMVNSRAV